MKRRRLLQLGLGAAVLLGVAGAGVALLRPGLKDNKLSPEARDLMRAVALAVLDGFWPTDAAARNAALDQHLARLDVNIANFPAAVRAELSQVLALLTSSGGRYALIGLSSDWSSASTPELQQALDEMRLSSMDTRQQIYRALRDLNCISYFTDSGHWSQVGYPGPMEIA